MATDLSTANVIDTKSGTGWTITVTAANLLSDLSIKDFAVLIDSVVEPNTSFTKTSQTVLTYTGASIPSSTIEVRRITPQDRFQEINFAEKLSSTIFNEEIDRIIRKAYEYTLNGIGPGSVATTVTPLNEAYPGAWSGDTVRSRTANRLFEEFEKRPESAQAETITGVWTALTASDATNNTQIATTAFAHTRVTNALSSSPSLGGNPTSVTPSDTDNDTSIATTAFVVNRVKDDLAAVRRDNDPSFSSGVTTRITNYNNTYVNNDSNFNATTGLYAVPVNNATYRINWTIELEASSGTFTRAQILIDFDSGFIRASDIDLSAGSRHANGGSMILQIATPDNLSLELNCTTSGAANYFVRDAFFSIEKLFE